MVLTLCLEQHELGSAELTHEVHKASLLHLQIINIEQFSISDWAKHVRV